MTGASTRGKPRPHLWISGTDPIRHAQYRAWQAHKAQCQFRQEAFDLTFEEYEQLWAGEWANRGRSVDSMCMTRSDTSGAWTKKNVELITRREHYKRQGHARKQAVKYSKVRQ